MRNVRRTQQTSQPVQTKVLRMAGGRRSNIDGEYNTRQTCQSAPHQSWNGMARLVSSVLTIEGVNLTQLDQDGLFCKSAARKQLQ